MRKSSTRSASAGALSSNTKAGAARPFGTVYYVSGEQYKGEWRDNKRHGQGVVTYKNGDKYGGEWQDGKRHGNGTLWVLRNGKYRVRFTGDWQFDLPEGSGLYFDDEGNSYEGEFQAGLRHGRGRAVTAAAAAVATAAAADGGGGSGGVGGPAAGDVYEGCWQHDKRHGPGTLMLANGDMFEGYWERDVKHGTGTFFYMSKGCRYDGVWHQGTPRCGSYSEIQPAPPGAPGSIPNIELCSPEEVLQEAGAAAAAGASMASAASETAAAAVAALHLATSGSWGFQHMACSITAEDAAGFAAAEVCGEVAGREFDECHAGSMTAVH